MAKKKNEKKIYKRWYFWVIVVVNFIIIVGILSSIIAILIQWSPRIVTVCINRGSHAEMGPCIETETVEIVTKPDRITDCPVGTEPVYDVVGGIVGVRFVGCARKEVKGIKMTYE